MALPDLHFDIELIRRAVDLFDWKKTFANTSVNKKVTIFNKTILGILYNFIPHKTLLIDDKTLHGLTIKQKNSSTKIAVFKHYCQNDYNLQILNKLESLQNLLIKSIANSKRTVIPGWQVNFTALKKV